MKELNIKQMTKEEFMSQYNLTEEQSKSYFAKGYPVSELGSLMSQFADESFIMIEGQLYKESSVAQEKNVPAQLINQGEVEKIEKLNDAFRDALISLREYMYHPSSSINSEKAKVVRAAMDTCLVEAREILKINDIKDIEALKKLSKKHFIAEFIEGVFGSEIYYFEDNVDCGL